MGKTKKRVRVSAAGAIFAGTGTPVFGEDLALVQTPWISGALGLLFCLFIFFLFLFQRRRRAGKDIETTLQDQTDELLRQDRLLYTVNEAASLLLASDSNRFGDVLRQGMEMMAHGVRVNRIYIWKKFTRDGRLCYRQIFEWLDSEAVARQDTVRSAMENDHEFPCIESIPEWESRFSEDICVNGPLYSLSPNERQRLASYGIKSILVIPVFLHESFWGFVSFDDCTGERWFSSDEEGILRSGSLLLVNAILRNETAQTLQCELARQETLASITLSMINLENFNSSVNFMLKAVGDFMKIDALCLYMDHPGEQKFQCVFEWTGNEKAPRQQGAYLDYSLDGTAALPEYGMILESPYVAVEDLREIEKPLYTGFCNTGVISFFHLPISVEGNFWGFLELKILGKPHMWLEGEISFLQTIGVLLGRFIENDAIRRNLYKSAEKAEAASRAKSDFLSNMSHEMRTPMNAIIGMTSIAKISAEVERKNYCLEKIEDASMHLLGVINDILDMSKIEANRFELSFIEFDFEKMLRNVAIIINFRVAEKQQNFSINIDRNIPRYLISDDQRLAQVVTNLLGNAVKFTPDHGSISMNADLLKEKNGLCTIRIEVCDTGIGISEEQQTRLFASFEQAESSTSRKYGGTGLGLAISKCIIELMGGSVWVKSALGKGSVFSFTIQARAGLGAQQILLGSGLDWSSVRILVVDDAPDIREYFQEIIKTFGGSCDVAASGEEAMGLINKNKFYDICFVDWKMDDMDGMELSRQIKTNSTGNSVVIMISSTEWYLLAEGAKNSGVDKFLAKPLFPSAIADCINQCLGLDNPDAEENVRGGEAGRFAGRRILLAEDVEINREIVLSLLEPACLTIDCAENGLEVVEKFTSAPDSYDLIFMDIQMPEMDGYEAARRIRASGAPNAKTIPIIAMTANVFKEDISKCLSAGMNDHMGKPLDIKEVQAKLNLYLLPAVRQSPEKQSRR
ncbi:MAG: response regulator [Treponema sp.]|jgi:signal transduction histidine kinase/DNA-binding response OmpR family regulator|nr:response regulator [Treponema sp.]